MENASYKICLFGDGGVGKTSLAKRALTGLFEEDIKMTLGINIYSKNLTINGLYVVLQIWDIAGEEQFRTLFPGYILGSSGAIFMYDINRLGTLKSLNDWIEVMEDTLEPNSIPIIMVGGKLDLILKRNFDKNIAEKMKEDYGFFDHIESSAKTGENVELIFDKLTREMMIITGLIKRESI